MVPRFLVLFLSLGMMACTSVNSTVIVDPSYSGPFKWSGYSWRVKYSDIPTAPRNNRFGRLGTTVFIDSTTGALVLRIQKIDSLWYAAEVVLSPSLGYGEYQFRIASNIDQLDHRAVLGLFTWDPTFSDPYHREIDIEFSRWGDKNAPTNAQYVVQPFEVPGNRHRFVFSLSDGTYSTHSIRWDPHAIRFTSWHGHGERPPDNSPLIIQDWTYQGTSIPRPGNEQIRINLYLLDSSDVPSDAIEVRVSSFTYIPLP